MLEDSITIYKNEKKEERIKQRGRYKQLIQEKFPELKRDPSVPMEKSLMDWSGVRKHRPIQTYPDEIFEFKDKE